MKLEVNPAAIVPWFSFVLLKIQRADPIGPHGKKGFGGKGQSLSHRDMRLMSAFRHKQSFVQSRARVVAGYMSYNIRMMGFGNAAYSPAESRYAKFTLANLRKLFEHRRAGSTSS
jgi:hypothetical protein